MVVFLICIFFPALLTFSDGRYIGAILDRNGLRPSRFYVTKNNHMYMSSEVGVTDLANHEVIQKVCYNVNRITGLRTDHDI